jgi:iron-sulfur cluster repair protein YtfE (RIC family)
MSNTTARTEVGEAIHNHHQEILDTLTRHVTSIVGNDDGANPSALVAFLKGDLLPHAQGEEVYLYPAVDPLVKSHGKATATMTVDHEFISGYIDRIEEATRALGSAGEFEAPAKWASLQRLCLQLEAVLALHLEKEERVYILLFEKYLPEEEQQRILAGMHEA